MAVNIGDATVAVNAVLKKYGPYLDGSVLAKVQQMPVTKIYRILPQAEYAPYFNSVFKNFFAAINVVALGGTKKNDRLGQHGNGRRPGHRLPSLHGSGCECDGPSDLRQC